MFILIRNDEIASKSLLPELNLLITKITILPTTTTFLVSPSLYFFQIITISKELKLISTQLLSWSRYSNDYLGYFAHCLSFSVIVYLCSLYLLFTFNFKVNPGFTLEFFLYFGYLVCYKSSFFGTVYLWIVIVYETFASFMFGCS